MLADLVALPVSRAAALAAIGWLSWSLWSSVTSPLRKYPGPFIAAYTNFWRFYHVLRLDSHLVVDKLHRKYGPIVRIGPNLLSIRDPSLVKTIYKFEDDWVKTEFYHGGSTRDWRGNVTYNIFGVSDRKEHAKIRRPIGKLYSMSNALAVEEHIDRAITLLSQELERRFIDGSNAGTVCPMEAWFLYFATDVVGDITFSQPFGYMAEGKDFDGTLADAEMAMNYLAVVGQIPILDFIGAQNPVLKLFMTPPFTTANAIAKKRLEDRLQGRDKATHDPSNPDFLDGFIEAQSRYPDTVDAGQIQSYLLINLIAGADTTAVTMTAIIYFLLKHPSIYARLEEEILAAQFPDDTPVQYKDAIKLPYLHAVIREAMRMHPAVGMPLERYVPASGLRLRDGSIVPGGVAVGMNPYIVSRTGTFGANADKFDPERWLRQEGEESEAEYKARIGAMNEADLTFGAGSRICGGRHIAYLQVYKTIATLLRQYRFELADPAKEWAVHNGWFMRQTGVDVRVSRRPELAT